MPISIRLIFSYLEQRDEKVVNWILFFSLDNRWIMGALVISSDHDTRSLRHDFPTLYQIAIFYSLSLFPS